MDILELASAIQHNPELSATFNHRTLQSYLDLINILRPKLAAIQGVDFSGPPPALPVNVHEFLKQCFSMADNTGKIAWSTLKDFAWSAPFDTSESERAAIAKHSHYFLKHGIQRNIGTVFLSSL